MKKILPLIFLFCVAISSAQETEKAASRKDSTYFINIGSGIGFNNYCGILGIGVALRLENTLFVRVGFGVSTWGLKYTGGLKYEFKPGNSWGLGVSYSSYTGMKNHIVTLETQTSAGKKKTDVTMDFLRVSTVNFTVSYKWIFRRKNNFHFDFGYALPIESSPYVILDGSVLTPNAKKVLQAMQPGGIIACIGLMFGAS
jgi:hypothetical protein